MSDTFIRSVKVENYEVSILYNMAILNSTHVANMANAASH